MTDSLAEALHVAEQRDREAAERGAAISRARQAQVRRQEAIRRENELREIDQLMRQPPGSHR